MREINFVDNKPFSGYFRGQYRFPVERQCVFDTIAKFPGITAERISERLDIEMSIIKDVVSDLYDSDKIWLGCDSRLFLVGVYDGGVS